MRNVRFIFEINVGSMVDIVFLLFIFFLVVIIIFNDKGIVWKFFLKCLIEDCMIFVKEWNVLRIFLNKNDEFFVNN